MCGIVGYIGPNPPVPIIIEGLRRLEYRGYDSAGIAIAGAPDGSLQLRRAPGKLRNLEALIADDPLAGTFGIGHTRWATHGRPTEENAHPHRDCTGTLVVVHNGIVENYLALKFELAAKGHHFVTETDTEIIAHLIEQELSDAATNGSGKDSHAEGSAPVRQAPIKLEEAVRRAVKRLTGAFAIGVLSAREPNKLVAARFGPPAVLGLGDGEYFLASDVPGILHHTRNIHFLADGELAILTSSGIQLTDFDGAPLPLKIQRISWDPIQAEKAGYKHFMLKEIYEQPRAIRDTILGRVSASTRPGLPPRHGHLRRRPPRRHPGHHRRLRNLMARRPRRQVHDRAHRPSPLRRRLRLRVPLPQSPSPTPNPSASSSPSPAKPPTPSPLSASSSPRLPHHRHLQRRRRRHLPRSSGTITTNAGPEIGVASTKAFTAQLAAHLPARPQARPGPRHHLQRRIHRLVDRT
jgi:glucosamine--fructose-6-phosphate aminotransferase (isomerizing)